MNYELAKELKEAGFPQKRAGTFYNPEDSIDGSFQRCYAPDLEELLEACGEKFGGLVRLQNGRWNAATPVLDTGMSYGNPATEIEEADPISAVAKLWLALNRPTK